MSVLIAGTLWTSLVTYLLLRVLRQSRVHSAGSLKPEMPRRGPVSVSIILSVRNETARVGACLQALLAQTGLGENTEIIVVDDDSTDGTAEQVARMATAEPGIKLIRSGPLPAGWMGKPHACWCGAMRAKADWICFVDADVRAAPGLMATAVAAADEQSVDLLSLSPFQELGSFWERLIVPVGLVLIGCAMDLHRIDDPAASDVSASGQFLLFRRDAYFAVGGHAAVRGEICEDKALAGRVKRAGMRFRLVGGERLARTRMYTDLPSLWEGFSKNAVEILGDAVATVTLAIAGLIFSWLALALPVWSARVFVGGPSAPVVAGFGLCLAGSPLSLGCISAPRGTVRPALVRSAVSSVLYRRRNFWPGPASCCGGPGTSNGRAALITLCGKMDPGLCEAAHRSRPSFRSTGAPPGWPAVIVAVNRNRQRDGEARRVWRWASSPAARMRAPASGERAAAVKQSWS